MHFSDSKSLGNQALVEDLEDLYENAPCGYLSLAPSGQIVKSNLTFSKWTGYSPQELLGKRFGELLNVAGAIFYETHFAPLLRMQGFFNEVALDVVTASGLKLAVLANALERRDEQGNLLFIRLTIFLATERRRYERELVEARDQARRGLQNERETAELREQFIGVLGHDLRNPLSAIDAGINRLIREGWTSRTPMILSLMKASITRAAGLVNNVMDFTRARLGEGIQLNVKKDDDLGPTLSHVVEELRMAYPDRTMEVALDIDQPVVVDHLRIAQMFSNLLANALTHGAPDKPIRVAAETANDFFELTVSNGGKPIPVDTMERLFQPFRRGTNEPISQGLGLGLYIASEIASAHGGQITAQSNDAETSFTFRMPLSGRAEGPAAQYPGL